MTLEELNAIEARAKAATEGPWTDVDMCWCGSIHLTGCPKPQDHDYPAVATDADRELMAAARSDVPALVAEVRRLQAEIERIQNAHEAEMEDRNWRETE